MVSKKPLPEGGYTPGLKMTPDQLLSEIERLRAALEQIAACKGQALLGCAPTSEYPHCPEDEKRAHEYGANKAFEQCAAIAHEALKQQEQDGEY